MDFRAIDLAVVLDAKLERHNAVCLAFALTTDDLAVGLGDTPERAVTVTALGVVIQDDRDERLPRQIFWRRVPLPSTSNRALAREESRLAVDHVEATIDWACLLFRFSARRD